MGDSRASHEEIEMRWRWTNMVFFLHGVGPSAAQYTSEWKIHKHFSHTMHIHVLKVSKSPTEPQLCL